MILKAIIFALLTALWCAAVWFALPLDLHALPPPTLAALHIGPPVALMAAWSWLKRLRARFKSRTEKAATAAKTGNEQAEIERRRAHVECRGVWMEVLKKPAWHKDEPPQCQILAQDAAALASEAEDAHTASLQRLFEAAFAQSGAAAYLPVFVARGAPNGSPRLEQIGRAWRAAVTAFGFEDDPRPDCRLLPGEGDIARRVIALIEHNPALPALLLAGMDSRLDETGAAAGAGHCAVVALFSRPGLALSERETVEHDRHDPYIPFWEFAQCGEPDSSLWKRIPVPLRPDLLALGPIARLYRARTDSRDLAAMKSGALTQCLRGLLDPLLVDTGLRDPPFAAAGEDGKKSDAGDAQAPPDVGWLVHDGGDPAYRVTCARLASIAAALNDFGCEIDPLEDASNLELEHGDTGAARGVLMLAESLIRTAQLRKPVLWVEFAGPRVGVGLTRPPHGTNT